MTKANNSHDFSILDSSGNEVGLMCVKDKNGTPLYAKGTLSSLTDGYYTGAPDYAATKPDEELRLIGSDWRGGAGLEYVGRPDAEKRYHYTINGDARFRGEFRLGPLAAAATMPTIPAPTILNADMELNSNWTNVSGTTEQSNAQNHTSGGTYSWLVNNGSCYQDMTWDTDYPNCYFSVTCWGYPAAGATGYVKITDGTNTFTSAAITGVGAWSQKTVYGRLASGAIRLRIEFHSADGNNVYFDDVAFAIYPTLGAMGEGADFNSIRYQPSGNVLLKLTTTTYSVVYSFEATITQVFASNVAGTDYLFICLGWSTDYYYMIAAGTFTQTNITGAEIKHMVNVAGTFYGSNTNSTIMSTTAPLASGTNWGTSKQIGDDTYDIVDIQVFNSDVYAKKSDCTVYQYDISAGTVGALVSGQANLAGTNTPRMYVHREASLIIPYGEQGLLHVTTAHVITHISPALYMSNAADFSGQVVAVTGDDQYLYVVLEDGTDVQIMATRQETVGSTTDWRWHPLATLAITGCQSASISSLGQKRLWVGSTTAGEDFTYYPITTKYGSIGSDTDYTYQTAGYLITPWIHCDLRGDKKAWIKITLTMGHTYNANTYFEAHYRKLGQAWAAGTDIGDFKGASGNMVTTAYIPVDSSTNVASSQMMQFKFVGITPSAYTTSPILLSYEVQAVWYPPQKQIIYTTVQVEEGQALKAEGQVETVATSAITTVLDELYNPTTAYPRQLYPIDYVATTYYVKALPPQKSWVAKAERGKPIKWIYEMALEVIPIS